MNTDLVLSDIADAILDGQPVDWSTLDSNDAADAARDRALVAELKTLETLRLGRRRDAPAPAGAWRWGHLRVLEPIGQGAYGDVYRAWDPRLDRDVALKLLPPDAPGAAPSDSLVIEEGRLLARVRHPNVVTIYGAERIDGRVGLWMEFVTGRTLEEALLAGQRFTAADVTRMGVELCGAVSAVHAAGLLHRDIKAQNVMLDDSGRLVLMDFGTGRELEATDRQIAGTPLYLAPEVLSGGAAAPQSDVYSIGVVLFRLMTHAYPVSGADLADLRRAHAAGGEAGARLDRAEIPPRFRKVLARAIDPDPARRFAGTDAFGAALDTLRAPAPRGPMPRARTIAAAAAVVAVAIAGGWNLGLRELARPALAAFGLATTPAIAVLPFRNAGSDPGSDDFIDGLTSEVIRNLAVIDGLHVRSQTSSFFFKGRPHDLSDVAARLNVDLVLEADVQIVGDRLRINAQLVRISENVPLWSEKFDRTIDDVFEIQDEISLAIVNNLRVTLGRGQRRYQTNLAAYELYLRGRTLVSQGGNVSAAEAAALFEQVIAMDPTFAPAHAGLAEAYAAWSWQLSGLSLEEGLAGMRPAAKEALDLDPLLPEAHAAMGLIYTRERDWESARTSFEQAMELGPSLTQIQADYAVFTLLPLGEAAKAEDLLAAALTIDPPSLAIRRDLGLAQFIGGRYGDAIENLRYVVAAEPTFFAASSPLARALMQIGRHADAIAFFESRPEHQNWERWMAPAYVALGRLADVERIRTDPSNGDRFPYRQALIYAALGDKDRTIEALHRSIDDAPHRTAFLLACPEMALLRGDPRLDELRRRLNLR